MHEGSNEYAYGLWWMVAANVVFVLIFVLSYLTPKRRFEWRSMGIFAAWVVALFTEMYGFPLTIYLLSNWLGRAYPAAEPFTHINGHLFAVVLGSPAWLVFAVDAVTSLTFLAALILMGSAFKQIHEAQGKLVTEGLYAYVRHPQYSALFLLILSLLIQWPALLSWLMAPILIVTYLRLARREERAMLDIFGEDYAAYRARTPAFLPAWRSLWAPHTPPPISETRI